MHVTVRFRTYLPTVHSCRPAAGLWHQDFPLKDAASPATSPFETDLSGYFACLGLPPGQAQDLQSRVRAHDFSSAKVHLIISVPGYHSGGWALGGTLLKISCDSKQVCWPPVQRMLALGCSWTTAGSGPPFSGASFTQIRVARLSAGGDDGAFTYAGRDGAVGAVSCTNTSQRSSPARAACSCTSKRHRSLRPSNTDSVPPILLCRRQCEPLRPHAGAPPAGPAALPGALPLLPHRGAVLQPRIAVREVAAGIRHLACSWAIRGSRRRRRQHYWQQRPAR